ncbi:hypothetical protein BD310DRAFT_934030 [Dichomitus squalens]|uniref:Uncharacterized protein n=1 Tax=Dichomitus squalens TaxID=114155 RepID=A0A4V2K7A0_9APHY|nr:hypothetical protein BD310DRAFT_934030 [Dichomitus squalens]
MAVISSVKCRSRGAAPRLLAMRTSPGRTIPTQLERRLAPHALPPFTVVVRRG